MRGGRRFAKLASGKSSSDSAPFFTFEASRLCLRWSAIHFLGERDPGGTDWTCDGRGGKAGEVESTLESESDGEGRRAEADESDEWERVLLIECFRCFIQERGDPG
jgi:hypothetical protein